MTTYEAVLSPAGTTHLTITPRDELTLCGQRIVEGWKRGADSERDCKSCQKIDA